MPTNVDVQNSQNPEAGVPSSSEAPVGEALQTPNPSSTPAIPAQPQGLKGSGLRYTSEDGVPDWAIGKTADEVLKITQELHTALVTNAPTPAPAPTPAYEAPAPASGVDPNLMYSNPAEYTRQLSAAIRAETTRDLATASSDVIRPLSQMARSQATGHRSEVWKAYGPEIDAVMARVPAQSRADISIWKEAVDIVAGRHVDTLARLKAEELMKAGDTGMLQGSGGRPPGASSTPASPIKALFADDHPSIKPFREEGLTAADVIAQAARMGHSETKYAEMLTRKSNRRVVA